MKMCTAYFVQINIEAYTFSSITVGTFRSLTQVNIYSVDGEIIKIRLQKENDSINFCIFDH